MWLTFLLFLAEPLGGGIYGANDTLIARTATKVPGDRFYDLITLRLGIFFQQGASAH